MVSPMSISLPNIPNIFTSVSAPEPFTRLLMWVGFMTLVMFVSDGVIRRAPFAVVLLVLLAILFVAGAAQYD